MLATPPILTVAKHKCDGDLSCQLALLVPKVSAASLAQGYSSRPSACAMVKLARSQAEEREGRSPSHLYSATIRLVVLQACTKALYATVKNGRDARMCYN